VGEAIDPDRRKGGTDVTAPSFERQGSYILPLTVNTVLLSSAYSDRGGALSRSAHSKKMGGPDRRPPGGLKHTFLTLNSMREYRVTVCTLLHSLLKFIRWSQYCFAKAVASLLPRHPHNTKSGSIAGATPFISPSELIS
jgi:hypothetical protein